MTSQVKEIAIAVHVGAGAFWVLSSLAIAVTRGLSRWILVLQTFAALMVVAAGTYLWHTLHAGRDGTTEHLLAAGTIAAFIGFALQIGVTVPVMLSTKAAAARLEAGALALYQLSALFLTLAAIAMLAARYG